MAPKDYETIPIEGLKEDKSLKINLKLSSEFNESLKEFLKKNVDLFAWKAEDTLSINPDIILHELSVDHT